MATVTKPIALDESFNTTEVTPRNIADVLAEGLSHITGRTASEVEYDNTDSGLTADNVQDAIDEVNGKVPTLPTTDIQTAVDEFETYNGGLLSECKVSLEPIQDLHGYPEPWVGGSRKNKIPQYRTVGNYTVEGATITVNDDNTVIINGASTNTAFIGWKFSEFTLPAGSYKINGQNNVDSTNKKLTLQLYNEDTLDQIINLDSNRDYQFTLEQTTNLSVRIGFRVGMSVSNAKMYPMIRLATETDSTFEPYENKCPISGHTEAKVGDDGKNILDNKLSMPYTFRGVTWTQNADGSIEANGKATGGNSAIALWNRNTDNKHLPSGNYTLSGCPVNGSISTYYMQMQATRNGSLYAFGNDMGNGITGAVLDTDVMQITCVIADGYTANHLKFYPQLELGSIATPYVPYNGYQITVNLGGTYYSGTLDVVSGVFVADKVGVDLGTLTYGYDSNKKRFLISLSGVATIDDFDITTAITSVYKAVSLSVLYADATLNGVFAISSNGNLSIRDLTYTDANTFQSAMSGQTIVYPLVTPQTIQLSPTMVKALVGENHLSAPLDGQEIVESKYKEAFDFNDVMKVANYFTLPLQTFTFTNKICNVNDSRVTSNSLVDVYFTSASMSSVEDAGITVESQNGKIVMTAEEQPVGTIQGRIKVVN